MRKKITNNSIEYKGDFTYPSTMSIEYSIEVEVPLWFGKHAKPVLHMCTVSLHGKGFCHGVVLAPLSCFTFLYAVGII